MNGAFCGLLQKCSCQQKQVNLRFKVINCLWQYSSMHLFFYKFEREIELPKLFLFHPILHWDGMHTSY